MGVLLLYEYYWVMLGFASCSNVFSKVSVSLFTGVVDGFSHRFGESVCKCACTMDERKRERKLRRCLQQLKRHNSEVQVSTTPTKILFVANSSVLCGVQLHQLEQIFNEFDHCEFVVFPTQRSYSFVIFQSLEAAEKAFHTLHGTIISSLSSSSSSEHNTIQPFFIAFVKNLPSVKAKEAIRAPAGLQIIENFCNENEEAQLLAEILPFFENMKVLKCRKVLHFGYNFNYDSNDAFEKSDLPIPKSCKPLIDRMINANIFNERPDQLTVNVYGPGDGIPSHVDTHSAFSDTIVSLSLISDLVMEFRDLANTSIFYNAPLPRFSLAVMKGESRYRWKHGIARRNHDVHPITNRLISRQQRISFTFRKVSKQKCHCQFVEYCDWDRDGTMEIPNDDEHGAAIEDQYVASVYESIADNFDTTRRAQWGGVSRFLKEFSHGTIVYDVGCGNGKYLKADDKLIKIGSDSCLNLCRIASEKDCIVVRADALALPFKNESANVVLCIAVLHHLSTENRRFRAIQEIYRVLEPGGRACITVWSMEQKLNNVASDYLKMRKKKTKVQMNRRESNGRLRVHEGRDFTQQDMLVPFQKADGQRFLRYYHLFVTGELDKLISKVGGFMIDQSFYEQGNWIVYIRKKK